LERAAIVWLDADLYSSTVPVLNFITPLVQDGTVLVFDDWFSFRGSPFKGVQKAFYEWVEAVSDDFVLVEYQRDSWKRNSFIVCKK
jgi:O-methyltransferase